MSENQIKYKLMVKAFAKSKARFLKFIPMKSFVEREGYDIYFGIKNVGEQAFPGGRFSVEISWTDGRVVIVPFPIKPLKVNEIYNTPSFSTDALSSGYGLISIYTIGEIPNVISNDNKLLEVEFYSDERGENRIDTSVAFDRIKVKTWEETYEFWGLVVAAISLAIIALEKLVSLLLIFLK